MQRDRQRAWRALFWLAVVLGVALALWPQSEPREPWLPWLDKIEHACSFAVLMWVGLRAGYPRVWALPVGLLVLGGAIELAQSFTATRSADWLDWLADAAGVAVTWSAARLAAAGRDTHSAGPEQEHSG
jgi:VanZ family protein